LTLLNPPVRRSLISKAELFMKTRLTLLMTNLVLATGITSTALAQGNPGTNPPVTIDRPASGQPALTQRPTVIPPSTAATENGPARPALPDQPTPSAELTDLVKEFQTARETFLKQQQELMAQMKTASKEEREALRQQLREQLEAWREQQKAQIEDIREQAREIKNNVPAIRDVVESGSQEGRNR
jgi:ElaB/YqjD/DUF883 family membrane-anchored ribosome-binding protein